MKNNFLIKYKSLHIVKTFNGQKYYIESDKIQIFKQELNNNKFINIKDAIINTSAIESVELAGNDINQLESKLYHIENESIKEKIRQTVFIRKKENSHKTLTDGVLENIILEFNK